MYSIDEIMDMLDWNNSAEIQQKGIELANSVESINVFILPANPRSGINVWDNCAKILSDKPDERLYPYLSQLLEWIEDLNWPGALIILYRLKKYCDVKWLSFNVVIYVKRAVATRRYVWLSNLAELLDNEKLKAMLPEDIQEILQKYYHFSWD